MKINDTEEIKAVAKTPATAPAKSVAVPAEHADKVSVEKARELEAAIAAARSGSGIDRSAKIQEIAAAVRKGQYTPNASQIAERILTTAELEAKLRAIFTR